MGETPLVTFLRISIIVCSDDFQELQLPIQAVRGFLFYGCFLGDWKWLFWAQDACSSSRMPNCWVLWIWRQESVKREEGAIASVVPPSWLPRVRPLVSQNP